MFYLGINLPTPIPSIIALLSFLIIPCLIIRQWKSFIYVATRDLLLLLAVTTAVMSVLWSTVPEATLAHNRALLSSTAFGIYLATRYTLKQQMRLMVWLLGIYTLVNLIVPPLFPAYGMVENIKMSWQGIATHKNSLAAAMSMAATLFLDIGIYGRKYYPKSWIALIGAAAAFIILIFSRGKTSLAIFIGLLSLLPLYKIAKQEYRLKTIICLFTLPVAVLIVFTTLINFEFIVVDLLGKDMEFTGRIPLWTYLIQRALEKPWLGYGYGAFWTNPTETLQISMNTFWMESIAGGVKAHAHNAYIDLFLQLGWLGVSLMLLSLVTVLIRIILLLSLTKQIEYFWMLQVLMFMTLASISGSDTAFLGYRSLYWVLYVSIACSTAIHLKRIFKTGNKLINLRYENTTYQH